MAAYYLSPALVQLRAEITALWPGRDKASDGWIGDAAHSARISDHNPDGDGSVNALDIDKDGIDLDRLIAAVLADSRTSYVIWSGRIWQRTTGRWSTYTGTNGHYHHVHISIRHGATWEQDRSPWRIVAATSHQTTGGASVPSVSTTAPTPITEAPDMDAVQDKLLREAHAAIARIDKTLSVRREPVEGETQAKLDAVVQGVSDIRGGVAGLPSLIAAVNGGDIDEAAIADQLATTLGSQVAGRVADELGKRLAS